MNGINYMVTLKRLYLFLIVMFITNSSVTAIDNTFTYDPVCISKSYDTGALLYGNFYDAVGTGQTGSDLFYDSSGNVVGQTDRITETTTTATNMLCSVQDPFTHSASGSRLWFVLSNGDIAYTDLASQDIGLGSYNSVTNPNGYHVVGSLTVNPTLASNTHFTFDQSGNVYFNEPGTTGNIIKKIDISLPYSIQSFYTITAADYDDATTHQVIDIAFDTDNNLEILIGTLTASTANNISRVIVGTDGVKISDNHFLKDSSVLAAVGTDSAGKGALIPDQNDPSHNFTYAWAGAVSSYVFHFSGAGTTNTTIDVGGGAIAGFLINDMEYDNHILYLTDTTSNIIRSLATNYEGFTGFNVVAGNPDGITGTFQWVNGYGNFVSTITPGSALAYKHIIDNTQTNYSLYDYYSAWSPSPISEPDALQELTNLNGLGSPAVFLTSSNTLAGSSIYGYLLSKSKSTGEWSALSSPVKLIISPSVAGFDSITLDKVHYNLTGDTITATFTYSSGFPPYFYQWQICSRIDCSDSNIFNTVTLAAQPATSTMSTDGMKQGTYYAVLMRHLPFLQNEIVASQVFDIRPPVIGVSWDKDTYNLFPKALTTNTCVDSTPSTSYFNNITGFAGLQRAFFSCNSTPADANANNSIMRGSIYARYNGTFYLNNSWGSIWNGTLDNGSGLVVYVLTNSSATGTWTLEGFNNSSLSTPGCNCGNESFYANAEVNPESILGYSLSVSPSIAYNQDTLYISFSEPIFITDYVELKDASGVTLGTFTPSGISKSGTATYYIDPSKQYTYGTWTAMWHLGSIGSNNPQGQTIFTFTVKNAGKPHVTPNIDPEDPNNNIIGASSKILQLPWFGLIALIVTIMGLIKHKANGLQFTFAIAITTTIGALIGIWNEWGIYITIISWLLVAGFFKLSKSQEV